MKKIKYDLRYLKRCTLLSVIILLFACPAFAQNLKVAVAANLQPVIKVLGADFTKKTGIMVDPIVGSSGNLVNQIKNGAPFDLFLSADMSFPEALYKDGLSTKQPVVYAQGSLIVCSTQDLGIDNWEKLVLTDKVKKVAIGNPAIAPYGKAAEEVLKKKGLLVNITQKVVYGESISQVNTYITTGVAEVGFTTQSLVKDPANKTKLYWSVIDTALYSPIEQGMVLLKRSESNDGAGKFYQYILSPAAKKIFKAYGYSIQ